MPVSLKERSMGEVERLADRELRGIEVRRFADY
jgi:hypothetical protein